MPALVAAAAINWGLGALVSAGLISLTSAVLIGVNVAYSAYSASRARAQAKDAYNAAQKDRQVTISLVDAPRSRIYGRVRNADGILFKGTYGDKKQYLQMVIALANHEVDGIETIYFGDVAVSLDSNGYVLTKPWNLDTREPFVTTVTLDASGNASYRPSASGIWSAAMRELDPQSVSAYTQIIRANGDGTWGNPVPVSVVSGTVYLSGGSSRAGQTATLVFQGSAAQSKARVRKFSGAPGQDLSPYLASNFPGLIQSGRHRFEGIACLLVDLEYNQDAFSQGIPHITAVMRGAKVTDRRTGVTAWTQNPSVIADDWARYAYGGGADESELDTGSFITAANACDVSHIFKTRNQDGTLIQTIRPMYVCGIALDTTADAGANFAAIVESMAGQWAWAGGRLRVRAGAYSAPVAAIDESWCSGQGDIEIVATQARSERVNVITPTIYNADANYTRAPLARVPAAAYIDLDGQELPQELALEGVTDVDHASHICGVMMREARQALTLKLPCKFKAYPLEVFDVVSVTLPRFGFSGKAFEVMATEMTQAGGVVLTLKETDASIFDPDAEFTREDPAPNTALPDPFTVPTLSITGISSGTAQLLKQADGAIVTRMLVTWDAIQDQAVREGGSVEVIARRVGATEQIVETVAGTETQAYLRGVLDGNAYAVTIRARNKLVAGLPSLMVSHVVQGKSQPPSNVAGLSASVIPGAVHITWTQCPDIDYDFTKLRYGASWAAGTELPFNRPGNSYDWPSPAPGTYTIWAAHVDTSGNLSAAPQSYTVVVTAAALYPANAALSIKLNVGDFAGTVNYAEAYIHGRDAAGNAIDAPGTILVNGVATAVPNGNLFTNLGPAAGYIVWDSAGATFNTGPGARPYVFARRYQGQWQYDSNAYSGATDWVNFTPAPTHFVIGTLQSGGPDTGNPGSPPGLTTSSIYAAAVTLDRVQWDELAGRPADSELLNSYLGYGVNLVPNSDQTSAMTWDWASHNGATYDSPLQWSSNVFGASSPYTLRSATTRNLSLHQSNIVGGGDGTPVADLYPMGGWGGAFCIPVIAGQRYCWSYYAQSHRCEVGGGISWFDKDGNFLSHSFMSATVTTFSRADELAIYVRPFVVAAAPAGAAGACPWVRKFNTWSRDSPESWMWPAAPQFEPVRADTTGPSVYTPGPVSKLGQLDATLRADLATAQTAASTAATNASNALSTLATMRSNGYIDASEKPALIRQWQAIADEASGIYAKGTTYGLTAARDAYWSAYGALGSYLSGLSPSWSDTTVDTPITPAVDQATWAAYYSTRQALLNAIYDEAAKRAEWGQVTGSGKPQDNATQNDLIYSSSAPGSPTYRMTWIDTSVTPRTIKIWSGSAWLLAGTYVNGTAQIVDDANLGLTAIWSGIAGAGKPADNATRNQVYFQDGDPVTSPGGVVDGAIWISSTKAWQRVSGAWQPYVGAGSIGTGELGAGSATDVLWTSASDIDIFSASGSTVGTMLLSYLAPYDCDVVVSTTGNIDQICSVAQWSTYADITANTSLTVSETTVRCRNVSSGDPFAKGTLAITKRFFQAAGTTVFYTLVGVSGGFPRTGPQAGCACWFRNQQMVLEAIKR